MNQPSTIVRTLLTCLALCAAAQASGQGEPPESSSAKLIKLTFNGGNAADYVAAVRKAAGGINVFVAPEAKEIPMPPIELTNATVSAALRILEDRRVNSSDRSIQLGYDEVSSGAAGEQPIYSILANVVGKQPPIPLQTHVWSMAGILTMGVKADDALTAVQTSLDLLGKDLPPAQLRFHEATGILIARANPEQLNAIEDVIGQLKRAAAEKRAAEGHADAAQNEAQQRMFNELQTRQLTIQKLQQRVTELETLLANSKQN